MIYNLEDKLDVLATKKIWISDIDGCLYPRDDEECGFISGLDETVANTFNYCADKDPKGVEIFAKMKEILADKGLVDADPMEQRDDKTFKHFIPLVTAINDVCPNDINKYMNMIYGDNYNIIPSDNRISKAFRTAQAKGCEIFVYTSGPSGKEPGINLNTQKVMFRHGFTNNEVDFLRPRSYDLIDAINAGGAGKPEVSSMENFLKFANIENPEEAVMYDDSIHNLKTAASFGITPVWTWTDDNEPSAEALKIANEIGAIRVRNTGAAMNKISNSMNFAA